MRQSFQDSEQRLLRASVNLLNQLAEVQKLREAIQSAPPSAAAASAGRQQSLKTEKHRPVKAGEAC
jgi:hypothetical protein